MALTPQAQRPARPGHHWIHVLRFNLAPWIEKHQHRGMSKQELVVLGQETADGCCPTLLTAPLDEEAATGLAKVFKALGDPVRLRLLSMIASRDGGEICVCDLTPAF